MGSVKKVSLSTCLDCTFCAFQFQRFFFFFFQRMNSKITWVYCAEDKNQYSRTVAILFMHLKRLKMGSTVLFTHLKIILLQCFQFSVSTTICSIQTDPNCAFGSNENYKLFHYSAYFATIHRPYCTFWYYSWASLYYFN